MSAIFSRTLRSLNADRPRPWGLTVLSALLAAWTAWFLLGQVAVYEVTSQARLEMKSAAHVIAAPVGGLVTETRFTLGREVDEGDLLVVLDSETELLTLQEKRALLSTLEARSSALRGQIETEQDGLKLLQKVRAVAMEESREATAKAEAQASFAAHQTEMLTKLRARNAVAEIDLLRSQSEAEASRSTVRGLELSMSRIEHDRIVQESDCKARLAKLEREAIDLTSEAAIAEVTIRRLEHEIALRSIRAPVSGRVGEAVEFHIGSVVRPAEKLGAIVPWGQPRAVALFPAAVIGRIRPSQPARLRLDGFPWTQYGTIAAKVADIGNEASAGLVRVELTLSPSVASAIPIGHGLPGSAEVEVERASPATLVLRAAGQFLTAKRTTTTSTSNRAQP
jgi:multidrug resistance efflux pump